MKWSVMLLLLAGTLSFANEPGRPLPRTETERADLEQRLNATWASLPLEAKARLIRLHGALNDMPPGDRRFIQERVERFLNMPPEERERLRQNREKWEKMSPEEREQARQEFRKRRDEFERRWREELPGEEPPPFRPQRRPRPNAEPPPPPPPEPEN
jgi:hypothetical protein